MTNHWGKLAHIAASAVHRLHVRSAMNPGLWLCAIATPMCFAAAVWFRDDAVLRNWLLLGGFLPILISCIVFVGFAIFKPEKLQSEDYQIRHESLALLSQKGGEIPIDPASIQAIANPVRPALEAPHEEAR